LLELAKQLLINYFSFLDEKEIKNQDPGFSAIKIGSLPKTQKLPRFSGSNSSSFLTVPMLRDFLFVPTLRDACQILW
jgi:hypothetical protein